MLLADAYLNQTALVRGDSGMCANLVGMIFCLLLGAVGVGLGMLWPLISGGTDVDGWVRLMAVVGGALIWAGGFYCLYRWLRIRSAVKLVRDG